MFEVLVHGLAGKKSHILRYKCFRLPAPTVAVAELVVQWSAMCRVRLCRRIIVN